jgi:hypothetical protein
MSFAPVLEHLAACEMPVDGSGLAAAVAGYGQYWAKLALAVAAFDESGEWATAGYTSTVAWLKEHGLTPRDGHELLRVGEKVSAWPVTAAAWLAGRLTMGQVKLICAQVIDRHRRLFGEHEAELVPTLEGLSIDDTAVAMRLWRQYADGLDDGPTPQDPNRNEARLSPTLDNRGLLSASLDAEGYALALEALRIADSNDLDVSAALRRGDALKTVFGFFCDHQNIKTKSRNRPHLNIVIDASTLGTNRLSGYLASTGQTLTPDTIDRLLCDCDLHRVVMVDGVILDYGRAVRTPPPDLWAAVVLRDHHCRFKCCDAPAHWCDAHHNRQWRRDKGKTSLDNLILLCRKHHNLLHNKGWSATLDADGTFTVTTPWGETWTTYAVGMLQQRLRPPPGRRHEFDELPELDDFALHLEDLANRDLLRQIRTAA